jgi:hypothetical protein
VVLAEGALKSSVAGRRNPAAGGLGVLLVVRWAFLDDILVLVLVGME